MSGHSCKGHQAGPALPVLSYVYMNNTLLSCFFVLGFGLKKSVNNTDFATFVEPNRPDRLFTLYMYDQHAPPRSTKRTP